ncbi:MAG: ABC transporter permease [Lachnospiraceae bacterium]|jgi:ribose transport system permease protein|nr:ABC transporter permease [Lachnospiraceae bacterium]GFI30798.1 autoinducer 2 import system permease protein LsrD [Lachnospiraceae bacterium]
MKKIMAKYTFLWPLLGSVILWIGISAVSGKFHVGQVFTSAKLCSFALLLALGQMIVVTSGEGAIDLSQQYILTLAAYISCDLMQYHVVLGVAAAVAAGALCGFVNGLINIYLKVPAMITTLATGYVIFTIVLVLAPGMKTLPDAGLVKFINWNAGGFSMLTILCLFVAAALALLLYRTKYGKQLHAVGQKRLAARYAGIPVNKVVILAFTLGGALCGLSGTLCGAFNGGAFQDMGATYFLPSIAAAFVGGTAASGGKSNVAGVCLGALMMYLLTTFLNAASLSAGMQRFIQGAVLVLILVGSVSGGAKKK